MTTPQSARTPEAPMTDSEKPEAPERVWVELSMAQRWHDRPDEAISRCVEYVRADRLAAMEPDPNARALYVRTDIDTAEEITRLREALEWYADSGEVHGSRARAALTDTASEGDT